MLGHFGTSNSIGQESAYLKIAYDEWMIKAFQNFRNVSMHS